MWAPAPGWEMSAGTLSTSGSPDGPMDRELATTAYPSLRYAGTRAAPIPCEAPVTMATFWVRDMANTRFREGDLAVLKHEPILCARRVPAPLEKQAHIEGRDVGALSFPAMGRTRTYLTACALTLTAATFWYSDQPL
jgi:hypothetical protein